MKISTAINNILNDDPFSAIALIAKGGFDCLDLSLFSLAQGEHLYLGDDWELYAKKLKEEAEKNNVYFNQAHAPFTMNMKNYLSGGEEADDILFRITRSIEFAAAVGAKIIVVHPVQCMDYNNFNRDEILEINKVFYGKLAPTALKCGIKIAIENMWRNNIFNGNIICSVCSDANELAKYVDECNKQHNCFGACLDIGHCTLTGVDPIYAINVLGDRLIALHVHDNDFVNDTHSLPLLYKINFAPIMAALKHIGYSGEFTLETDSYFAKMPPELLPDAITFAAKVCRYLTKDM